MTNLVKVFGAKYYYSFYFYFSFYFKAIFFAYQNFKNTFTDEFNISNFKNKIYYNIR